MRSQADKQKQEMMQAFEKMQAKGKIDVIHQSLKVFID
jgi:hypothetical protein